MKVSKWGNSLAIRIPADVAQALGLKEGDDVNLAAGESGLRVSVDDRRARALEALRSLRGALPADYRFDRDEANAR
jgi:antitoxin MazE